MMRQLSHAQSVLLWLLAVSFVHHAVATSAQLCASLASALPGRVAYPKDPAFLSSQKSYGFLQQQNQKPTCIVRPTSTAQVSKAVKILKTKPAVPYAIRSGGHATNKGFSNIDNSITLDLTSLDSVTILKDGVTASIGTGATWGDVYPVLDAKKRGLNGGRAANVGVGGFLGGGGIGFYALKHGFGCDAVTNVEVVLANGNIIQANSKTNKDLFVALKGGGNNFGIVTKWDIKTVAQTTKVWGGGLVFPNTTTEAQLKAFTTWKTAKNFDASSSVEQSHVYVGAADLWIVASLIFYDKPTPFPAALKPLTSIQPQMSSSLRLTNITDLANEIQSQSTPNQYSIFATTTIKISPTILKKVHTLMLAAVAKMRKNGAVITSSMTLQSIPSPPSDSSRANSLGWPSSSTPQKDHVLVLLSVFWDNNKFAAQVEKAVKEFFAEVDKTAKKDGLAHGFKYPNYSAAGFQDPLGSTGQLGTLRKVAKKYDPQGMFQRQVIGGWKLNMY